MTLLPVNDQKAIWIFQKPNIFKIRPRNNVNKTIKQFKVVIRVKNTMKNSTDMH